MYGNIDHIVNNHSVYDMKPFETFSNKMSRYGRYAIIVIVLIVFAGFFYSDHVKTQREHLLESTFAELNYDTYQSLQPGDILIVRDMVDRTDTHPYSMIKITQITDGYVVYLMSEFAYKHKNEVVSKVKREGYGISKSDFKKDEYRD